MKDETMYILLRDWEHPYKTYPAGCIYNATIWGSYLGCSTTPEEFEVFFKAGRFDGWFKVFETTDRYFTQDMISIARGKRYKVEGSEEIKAGLPEIK